MAIVCTCGSHRVKLMWEYYGWGLWCAHCGRPLRPEDLPIPADLAEQVVAWNRRCAELARRELGQRGRAGAEWRRLEEEGRSLRVRMDRHVRTYLYRLVRGEPGLQARCPDCLRPLHVQGSRAGITWGLCEECMLWVVAHDPGPPASTSEAG